MQKNDFLAKVMEFFLVAMLCSMFFVLTLRVGGFI